ncbi:helix-turn-helix domain-containing protein [Paenibacillus enshidis]|uniref:Helix-turn-helix domain-containing protein n=1 Tax=Paenibacillus enshidis TaxID=1458439 RepID=A0ABV5AXS7_9BACL
MSSSFAEQIGAKIRFLRKSKNWTQDQLAEISGTTASYIGQIERGEKDFRIHTIERIAKSLDMSVYDLFATGNYNELEKHKWVWSSILLLMQQSEQKQYKIYRVIKELANFDVEPGEERNSSSESIGLGNHE